MLRKCRWGSSVLTPTSIPEHFPCAGRLHGLCILNLIVNRRASFEGKSRLMFLGISEQ